MEIERKWEIAGFPAGLPETDRAWMAQGYLTTAPTVRIRSERRAAGTDYILCIKGRGTLAREEIETPLTAAVFARIAALIAVPLVQKEYRAYRLPDGHRLEVARVNPGESDEFYYAEVEFDSVAAAEAFAAPALLGRELTQVPGSSMGALWERRAALRRAAHGGGEETR